jgi:hypothetical protein
VGALDQELPEQLLAPLGDAFLRVGLPGLALPGGEPEVGADRAAPPESGGVLQHQHEGERRDRPDAAHLPEQGGLRVELAREGLQPAVVSAYALGLREAIVSKAGSSATASASGTCSRTLRWKPSALHLRAGEHRRT